MHCDYIWNQWASGYQELIEKISPDDPRTAWKSSSYSFVSKPHSDENCPFRTSKTLPFEISSAKL